MATTNLTDDELAPQTYAECFAEVRDWLLRAGIDSFMRVIDGGYDDLDAISRCNDEEFKELVRSADYPANERDILQRIVTELRREGIDAYRRRIHAAAPTPAPASPPRPNRAPEPALPEGATRRQLDVPAIEPQEDFLTLHHEEGKAEARYFVLKVESGTPILLWRATKKASQSSLEGEIVLTDQGVRVYTLASGLDVLISRGAEVVAHVEFDSAENVDAWLPSLATAEARATVRATTMEEKEERIRLDDPRFVRFVEVLRSGAVFTKIKGPTAPQRLIYCTADLTKLAWAQPNNKKALQGFLPSKEITDVETEGTKMFVVAVSRNLELESNEAGQVAEWSEALKFLVQYMRSEEEAERKWLSRQENARAFSQQAANHRLVLVAGENFRKFNKDQKDPEVRFVYFTPALSRLEWKAPGGSKATGGIAFEDILQVMSEKSRYDNKLCIVAKKAVLVLEAKDTSIKDGFVQALDFYLRHPEMTGSQ